MGGHGLPFVWALAGLIAATGASVSFGQTAFDFDGGSFRGTLHDNISNRERQGSGFTPLVVEAFPGANLFRDDAVGINFEHIFNGAAAQHEASMFTPRHDPCHLTTLGEDRFELRWPAEGSTWGVEAKMAFDLTGENQIDLEFQCIPNRELFPQGFAAMMWASYMNRAADRRIHFWGEEGGRRGWVAFGESDGESDGDGFETGTVAHAAVRRLPYEEGAQTLNLFEHPSKKFVTPFYYGLLDGDQDLATTDDRLLFLVLFDQAEPIRFAMWNFIKDAGGSPDTHSPAWDWQYVIRDPVVGQRYGYRARVVIKPFEGRDQVWDEYRRWGDDLGLALPAAAEGD